MEKKSAIEILAELEKLPAEKTLTKKELEKISGLTDVTVSKTIDASTLSTSDREYKVSDLIEWYIPARQGIDEGKTYEEIKQILLSKRGVPEKVDTSSALDLLLIEGVTGMIGGRLELLLRQMPALINVAFQGILDNPKLRAEIVNKMISQSKVEPLTLDAEVTSTKLLPSNDKEQ